MSAIETVTQADLQRRMRDYKAMHGIAVCELDANKQITRIIDPSRITIAVRGVNF